VTQDRDDASTEQAGDDALAEAFWAVARQLRERSQETLAPWDITPAHLRALRTLRRHGTMRLSELSDHLHIAPRSTTEVVDALEARDLVRRRADPGDRRATLVEVTEHGADMLTAIRDTRGAEAGRREARLINDGVELHQVAARRVGRGQRAVDDVDIWIGGARVEANFERLEDL